MLKGLTRAGLVLTAMTAATACDDSDSPESTQTQPDDPPAVDPCLSCSPDATCVPDGETITCTCKQGYTGNGRVCEDIDECALGTAKCAPYETCENTPGSFTCILACDRGEKEGEAKIDDDLSLEAMAGYTSVSGSLTIAVSSVTSLQPLACLTRVKGDVVIGNNEALATLEGLDALAVIDGSLVIGGDSCATHCNLPGNDALTSLDGLGALTTVRTHLHISHCSSLTDLGGLSNLTKVGGHVELIANGGLTDLSGLGNLASVGYNLWIWYNSKRLVRRICGRATRARVGARAHDRGRSLRVRRFERARGAGGSSAA